MEMDWNVTLQLAVLVIAYIGGIGTIGYYITNALGKRVDDKLPPSFRQQLTRFK